MRPKKLQMPIEFFDSVCGLLEGLDGVDLPFEVVRHKKEVKRQLDAKLDAIERREIFTLSKTAETPEDREAARQEYCDKAGIHKDWRWKAGESPYNASP